MLKSLLKSIAYNLHDIIFIAGLTFVLGTLVYHSIYPRGYVACEQEAYKARVEFTYNSFDGCKLIGGQQ